MAKKIGIAFPFTDSEIGDYFKMTITTQEEVKSNIIFLLTTRVGERYMLPRYGTRLMEMIFDPNDAISAEDIKRDLQDAVDNYLPNVRIDKLEIINDSEEEPYKVTVSCDFAYNSNVFSFVDRFIIRL